MSSIRKSHFLLLLLIIKKFIFGAHTSSYQRCLYKACIAVACSCFLIILIDSLIKGMHKEVLTSLKGPSADLTLVLDNECTHSILENTLKKIKKIPHIENAYAYGMHHCFLQMEKNIHPILVIAWDKNNYSPFFSLEKTSSSITKGSLAAIQGNKIALAADLAQSTGCELYDRIRLITSGSFLQNNTLSCQSTQVECRAFIIDEIHKNQSLVIDAHAFERIAEKFPFTHIFVSLKPSQDLASLQNTLQVSTGLECHTWKDDYPSLDQSIYLQRASIFLIIILLIVLSGLTSQSLLSLFFQEKIKHLATLKIMGAPRLLIDLIMSAIGAISMCLSSFGGCIAGALLAFFANAYQIIPLHGPLYTTYLPFEVNFSTLATVIVLHLFLGIITGLLAAHHLDDARLHSILKGQE